MKFGTQLATFVSDIQSEPKVDVKIRQWIDSNTLFLDQRYVWRIGISTAEHILLIESKIRKDVQCKHWKYWHVGDFKQAMGLIRRFNKLPFTFKSPMNEYIGKGAYLFVYKTVIPEQSYFFHTLRG
jgi:hypothetical protein